MSLAITKLSEEIEKGRHQMAQVLTAIQGEFDRREDYLIPKQRLSYNITGRDIQIIANNTPWELTDHSLKQLYMSTGIPATFADKLLSHGLGNLLKRNLEELTLKKIKDQVMIRTVGNHIKGFLSPSYKRIDASPVFQTFLETTTKHGYVPYRGANTDSRYLLKMIQQDIFQAGDDPNEAVVFGVALSTGDYGGHALKMIAFILRVVCLNGMLGVDTFRQVHIGKRFSGNTEMFNFSKKTLALDERAMISGVKDVVRRLPEKIEETKERILRSVKNEPSSSAFEVIKKKLSKEEFNTVRTMYDNNNDSTMLPKEKSTWRLSNAISCISKNAGSDERRISLEEVAGNLLK